LPTANFQVNSDGCLWCGGEHQGRGEFCSGRCRASWHSKFRFMAKTLGFLDPGRARQMLVGPGELALAMMGVLIRRHMNGQHPEYVPE